MYQKIKINLLLTILLTIFFYSKSYAQVTFLSLKKDKVNVRYGPSFEFPVKFIYKKINLPVKQIDTKENWRRVIDFKNNSGWIHLSQLKQINSIISLNDKILFSKPTKFSKPIAKIRKGRVLFVQKCNDDWCKIKTNRFKGWIKKEKLWGK